MLIRPLYAQRGQGKQTVIARQSEKHTNNSCHHYVCHSVAVNNESTLKTQLYIIEGRAAGHTARLESRVAAQALGELERTGGRAPVPRPRGSRGTGWVPGPERGRCNEPRWHTARGEGMTPEMLLEGAGSPRSVTRSVLWSIRWSEWHKHSYQWGHGGEGRAATKPQIACEGSPGPARHPTHLAVPGLGPRPSMSPSPALLTCEGHSLPA